MLMQLLRLRWSAGARTLLVRYQESDVRRGRRRSGPSPSIMGASPAGSSSHLGSALSLRFLSLRSLMPSFRYGFGPWPKLFCARPGTANETPQCLREGSLRTSDITTGLIGFGVQCDFLRLQIRNQLPGPVNRDRVAYREQYALIPGNGFSSPSRVPPGLNKCPSPQ